MKNYENLLKNPAVQNAIKQLRETGSLQFSSSNSIKFDSISRKLKINDKEINSIEDLPEPFKSMAKKVFKDDSYNVQPDIVENLFSNTNTAKSEKIDPIEKNAISTNPIKEQVSIENRSEQTYYQPTNLKLNPLQVLQVIVGVALAAGILFWLVGL